MVKKKQPDSDLLRDLELDHERALAAVAHLEEQIREIKNRIQGKQKRNIPRP